MYISLYIYVYVAHVYGQTEPEWANVITISIVSWKACMENPRSTYDNATCYKDQDLSSVTGILIALQQILRVQRDGLVWLGVPCASFGFMASSGHRRSQESPLGDVSRHFVRLGNLLSSRASLLAVISMTRGCFWFIENPGQSTLGLFPYLKWMLSLGILNCKMMHGQTTRWLPDCVYGSSILCHVCSSAVPSYLECMVVR